ncbi:MAG: hypothetical protein VYE50_01355 [Candidatus Thermoplasmatota archaeon]|nr:hypothetical protein [Candidatus Thermoplasmatota archaeon]
MSVEKYQNARNNALRMMALGLVFLLFLPVGIPVSLIIIPFLAGRSGAKELPNNWHWTYILTVGGGWAIGLVVGLFVLLSLALGPSLKIDVAEPLIFGIMIIFTWGSFTIGVRSAKGLPDNVDMDEEKWAGETDTDVEIEEDEDLTEMALPQDTEEEKKSATDKLKSFFGRSTKKTEKPKKVTRKTKKPKSKKSPKGKPSRVSALANRRRK